MSALPHMIADTPDDVLVDRCQRGDRHAFAELVTRYQDRIVSLCRRWLGEGEVAEEVAQDVFVAAWRGLPNFRAEARFDTWLRRIAVNKCKNRKVFRFRRGWGRHESLDAEPEDGVAPLQLVHGGPGADAAVHRAQAGSLLARGLAALPEEHRAILVLRDLEDLSYDEIGEILDIPRGTVKSRIHRARLALAQALGRHIGPQDVF
ncbi:MAG: sigma-70 family RNA polymerase sigma factor [Alphaproteobacteria bacterium]|nr:sigma-70 family RNA polymerase sigma factor [Alphaproteobacteria bacterium]